MSVKTITHTFSSVTGSGGTASANKTIDANNIAVLFVKIEPSVAGGTADFEIFQKDTELAADLSYKASAFTGDFFDPVEDVSGTETERTEGFVTAYQDDDASLELHIRVTNNDTTTKNFDITIRYLSAGDITVTGTPANNQIAVWTDVDTLEGDANLTWDGSIFTVSGNAIIPDTFGLVIGHTAQINFGAIPEFQILGTGAADSSFAAARWGAVTGGPTLRFLKSRNATIGSNTIVLDGDELGRIRFQADDGTDYNTNAAEISAEVDGTPGVNDMPGRILFKTTADGASSVTERMRIDSAGLIAITGSLTINTALSLSNSTEGDTAKISRKTAHETHTLSLATTSVTTTLAIPAGARLIGASFNVNTAVVDDAGDDTWSAAFSGGSTTTLATAEAAAQNTKVDTQIVDELATATTEITFTPNGGSFSAGVIEVVVYYEVLTSLANV